MMEHAAAGAAQKLHLVLIKFLNRCAALPAGRQVGRGLGQMVGGGAVAMKVAAAAAAQKLHPPFIKFPEPVGDRCAAWQARTHGCSGHMVPQQRLRQRLMQVE